MPMIHARSHRPGGVLRFALLMSLAVAAAPAIVRGADNYQFDPAHSSVTFKIQHLGISWVQGRFDSLSGSAVLDAAAPAQSSFQMTLKSDSVDTNVKQRDDDLRSPRFLDAKAFPEMVFKSREVKKTDAGLEVTGDFTLHGVTKPVTFTLVGGQTAEFPKGTQRVGYVTEFSLKRADFGMTTDIPDVGDEVRIFISLEAIRK